jgi:hypothetical protein
MTPSTDSRPYSRKILIGMDTQHSDLSAQTLASANRSSTPSGNQPPEKAPVGERERIVETDSSSKTRISIDGVRPNRVKMAYQNVHLSGTTAQKM